MNIKRINAVWFIIICFMQIGCFNAESAFQTDLESLKIINTDIAKKTVWYVPIKATITGFGNNGKAIAVKMGNKRLVQGMIKIAPDEEELKLLSDRAQKMWGSEAQVRRNLGIAVEMKITFNGKKLWQHKLMSGNANGLPLQLIMPKDEGGELLVSMSFFLEKFTSRKKIQIQTFGARQQKSISGAVKSSSVEATGSVSVSGSNNQNPGNFKVEQLIKIE